MENKLDLSKPFIKVIREDDTSITYGVNSPNDQVGDQAFEWDLDGSQRKRWEEYLKELDEKGILGDLSYIELTLQKNEAFDIVKPLLQEYPIESYKFIILDVSGK